MKTPFFKRFKQLFFSLFAIFLCFRSLELVKSLLANSPSEFDFLETFILAFLLTLFITGIFAFLGFAFSTHKILPEKFYRIQNPAMLKRAYKWLGITYFKFVLMATYWGHKKNKKRFFNGTKGGLKNFVFQSKQAEFGHFGGFVIILSITFFLLAKGYILLFFIANITNIIGNLYPIILQRMHRLRLEKILPS